MTWVYLLIAAVAIIQIAIFVVGRRLRKKEKENNVILKYNINTRQEAWKLMADPSTQKEDKAKIKKIDDGEEE